VGQWASAKTGSFQQVPEIASHRLMVIIENFLLVKKH
jgi:hypothetical protein